MSAQIKEQTGRAFELMPVPEEWIDQVWPQVRDWIDLANSHSCGEFSTHDIWKRIKSRQYRLWGIGDGANLWGAGVTSVETFPQKRILHVRWLGGSGFAYWGKVMHATLEEYARTVDCDGMEIYGRRGWLKLLRPLGYEEMYTTLYRSFR